MPVPKPAPGGGGSGHQLAFPSRGAVPGLAKQEPAFSELQERLERQATLFEEERTQLLAELAKYKQRVDQGADSVLRRDSKGPLEVVEARVAEAADDTLHARRQLEMALHELRTPAPLVVPSPTAASRGGLGERLRLPAGAGDGPSLQYFRLCSQEEADLQALVTFPPPKLPTPRAEDEGGASASVAAASSSSAASAGGLPAQLAEPIWLPPRRRDGGTSSRSRPLPLSALEEQRLAAAGAEDDDQDRMSPVRPIRLLVFTWNMGEAKPDEDNLQQWLPRGGAGLDLVAVTLQETRYTVPLASPTAYGPFGLLTRSVNASDDETPGPAEPKSSGLRRQSSDPNRPFPHSLGPLGVAHCSVLPVVNSAAGTYEMPRHGLVATLADAHIRCSGALSPPHALEAHRHASGSGSAGGGGLNQSPWAAAASSGASGPPREATTMYWAYPTNASTEEFRKGLSRAARAALEHEPNCALLLFGGFIYTDATGRVLAAEAVCPGRDLYFNGPFPLQPAQSGLIDRLRSSQRLHPITIADLWDVGGREFAWLLPGEDLEGGCGSSESGGFVYVLDADAPGCAHGAIYFALARRRLRPAEHLSADAATNAPGAGRSHGPLHSHRSWGHFKVAEVDSDSDEAAEEGELHHFLAEIASHLGPEWRTVTHLHLMSMRAAVYARSCLPVTNVATSWAACGLGHMLGNKGGLVVALEVRGTSFCFVGTHLAAQQNQAERRHEDCRQILRRARVGNEQLEVTAQFDHCIWFGDLNYRLERPGAAEPPPEPAPRRRQQAFEAEGSAQQAQTQAHQQAHARLCALARGQYWQDLMALDQLRNARSKGRIFVGFEEGEPQFAPTFKLRRASGFEYDPQRLPAYCDRILWKSLPHCRKNLRQTALATLPEVSSSDHKPVYAHFEIKPTASPQVSKLQQDSRAEASVPIYITQLEAEGLLALDTNGKSDPYVVFHSVPAAVLGHCPVHERKTKSKSRTLHPRWDHTELPVLRTALTREQAIRHLDCITLLLDLYDHDYMKHDEHLGTAIVGLAETPEGGLPGGSRTTSSQPGGGAGPEPGPGQWAPSHPPRTLNFWAPVVRGNERCGSIHGQFLVDLGANASLKASAGFRLARRPGAPCCHIL